MKTSKRELVAINSLPAEKRYNHFVKRAADFEMVWGLYDKGWALSEDDADGQSLPLWPAREYAELCRSGSWEQYEARSIRLPELLDVMLPDLQKKGLRIAISTLPGGDGVVVDPQRIRADLEAELEKY